MIRTRKLEIHVASKTCKLADNKCAIPIMRTENILHCYSAL